VPLRCAVLTHLPFVFFEVSSGRKQWIDRGGKQGDICWRDYDAGSWRNVVVIQEQRHAAFGGRRPIFAYTYCVKSLFLPPPVAASCSLIAAASTSLTLLLLLPLPVVDFQFLCVYLCVFMHSTCLMLCSLELKLIASSFFVGFCT
jgi:hypothetical protein